MNSERTSPGTIASTTSLSISSSGSCDDNDETAHFYPNPHDNNSLRLLQLIPVTLFSEILAYLSLSEGRYFCQTCHYLWNISSTLESHRCCIDITKTSVTTTNTGNQPQHEMRCLMYPPICSNWNNVRVLHLSNFATDKILFTLQNQLPNLQELYMNGSGGGESSSDGDLTDFGLLSLMMTENPSHSPTIGFVIDRIRTAHLDVARCRNLRYIDVTECSGTSYYATIILRNKLQHPDLIIRRIPKWIEGHFLRNQKNGIFTTSSTFYADGSFLHDKESSNCGYICDLWKWPSQQTFPSFTTSTNDQNQQSSSTDEHEAYGTSSCYINIEHQPRWRHYCLDLLYPGVTFIRYCGDENGDESSTSSNGVPMTRTANNDDLSVIVVQNVDGVMLSPQSSRCPIFRNAPSSKLQLGLEMYRDADGNVLSANTNMDGIPDMASFSVSRTRKHPLQDEMDKNVTTSKSNITDTALQQISYQRNSSMPPHHIVTAIQIFEEQRMKQNRNEIRYGHNLYWDDDEALTEALEQVNQLYFDGPLTMESPDRFFRMIRRQKNMQCT